MADLRQKLVTTHREQFGRDDDLLIGLQLTHSGRFARPRQEAHGTAYPLSSPHP